MALYPTALSVLLDFTSSQRLLPVKPLVLRCTFLILPLEFVSPVLTPTVLTAQMTRTSVFPAPFQTHTTLTARLVRSVLLPFSLLPTLVTSVS